MKKVVSIFKSFLANLIFPKRKDNKSLIICFIGVRGVGKSTISHYLRSHKISRHKLGSKSAKQLGEFLNISIPEKYKKILNFFEKNYPHLGREHLIREIYTRILNRTFYVDESILNDYPLEVLKDFYKKEPKLFNDFFKNTLIIWVKDIPENILKKVNKRITEGKERSGYNHNTKEQNLEIIKKSVTEIEEKIKFLKTCTNIFRIQAQLSIPEKVQYCQKAINAFEKSISNKD